MTVQKSEGSIGWYCREGVCVRADTDPEPRRGISPFPPALRLPSPEARAPGPWQQPSVKTATSWPAGSASPGLGELSPGYVAMKLSWASGRHCPAEGRAVPWRGLRRSAGVFTRIHLDTGRQASFERHWNHPLLFKKIFILYWTIVD